MTEIERILHNNDGQKPKGQYDILRILDVRDPAQLLQEFKDAIIALLENMDIPPEDERWKTLMPPKLVEITDGFVYEDYRKDDLVRSLNLLIARVQNPNLKEWEWYSSELRDSGFDVYFKGIFRVQFTSLIRFLGVPQTKIRIMREGEALGIGLRFDVIQYKNLER